MNIVNLMLLITSAALIILSVLYLHELSSKIALAKELDNAVERINRLDKELVAAQRAPDKLREDYEMVISIRNEHIQRLEAQLREARAAGMEALKFRRPER